MNLKYYLRGLGIGLIVTTIILAVSNNVESSSGSGSTGTVSNTEKTTGSVIAYDRESTTQAQEVTKASTEAATQEPTTEESTTEAATQEPTTIAQPVTTEAATQATTQAATEAATTKATEEATTSVQSADGSEVTIVVKDIYYGTQMADLLYGAGIITDRDDFVQYLINTGYGKYIQEGTYTIRKGEDYGTICSIVSKGRI